VSVPAGRNRRRVTTAVGVYTSAALGILGTLIVFRVLGPRDAGRFSIVIGVVQFLSLLIELTADEALVKFGFRYAERGDGAASIAPFARPSRSRRRRRSRPAS
jgi:O-antigen/teichoic acid export membrane protein